MADILKLVVAGPFGSGKTTFVTTACSDAIGAERAVTDATSRLKEQTTVAMDHGTARIAADSGEQLITLFGTPGQERFSFMWPMLAQGMAGYVLLVDASRLQAQAQLKSIVRRFAEFAPNAPFILAANRWDPAQVSREQLASFVGVPSDRIVACDPRSTDQAHAVLAQLLGDIESRTVVGAGVAGS
ncbi:GTP-binding protein [Demequina activiva]|uniref:Small GTP-binding protein n=1 Tax=Demequina activiva TaxID=1582364 RepID=A0A919Q4P8_9MICO|nr:ATP/GTP-binding protein [Demequina activiva]GIG55142.1 small GTP-binding protein [Demequina activiva]